VLQPLKSQLDKIIKGQNLSSERALVNAIVVELGIDLLECAAALVYLNQANASKDEAVLETVATSPQPPTIKMVRYRLNVGIKQQVTVEALKQVLVEESGVDINNIKNLNIRDDYTLVELPDAMPADIFQHLKTVAINQHELDIKRLKARYKKRGGYQHRRGRGNTQPEQSVDPVKC
jgi:hypothetical protein